MTSSTAPTTSDPRHHVVVAGGGVAAVECALALRDLAADRVRLTIVAPNPDFELRALRTAEPFARDHVRRHALADLAAHVGAELVGERVVHVRPEDHRVLAGDRTIAYDALVLAVGGRQRTAYRRALTFAGDVADVDIGGLLADIDEGYARAVDFVVPPGTRWPVPLYELALMTAGEAWGMGNDRVRLRIVSPEAAPLVLFGPRASAAMGALLDRAGIAFRGGASVREAADGRLEVLPGGEPLDAERVVALPIIEGPGVEGVPADARGFIPVDADGRVRSLTDVWAAGDGTTFPVKQGGLACQQADAIAERLAADAGAPVTPRPWRPVLRGRVLAGRGAQYLEHALHGGDGEGPAPELRLWSATRKVEGRYLSPWLASLEGGDATGAEADALAEGAVDVDVDLTGDDRAPAPVRCAGCGAPLGAYEPLVYEDASGAPVTSALLRLPAELRETPGATALFHAACHDPAP